MIRRLLDISENIDCDCVTIVIAVYTMCGLEKETNENQEYHTEYTGNHTEMYKHMVVFPNVKGQSDTKEQGL